MVLNITILIYILVHVSFKQIFPNLKQMCIHRLDVVGLISRLVWSSNLQAKDTKMKFILCTQGYGQKNDIAHMLKFNFFVSSICCYALISDNNNLVNLSYWEPLPHSAPGKQFRTQLYVYRLRKWFDLKNRNLNSSCQLC